jgi:hypothetical protein
MKTLQIISNGKKGLIERKNCEPFNRYNDDIRAGEVEKIEGKISFGAAVDRVGSLF